MRNVLFSAVAFSLLSACSNTPSTENITLSAQNQEKLQNVLNQQSEENKARFDQRHPLETLTFFNIEPGMTVVEALPGQGWYSAILAPYLGSQGHLIGADYEMGMFKHFSWVNEEFIENRKNWGSEWSAKVPAWAPEDTPKASAYNINSLPESLNAKVDAVLFIRALHNMARFSEHDEYLTRAINESYQVLKPGGIVGVVQHQAPEDISDAWANGANGYLKKSFVIDAFEKAGFKLMAQSDINENVKDQPTEEDSVWRLPPSLRTDNEQEKEKNKAVGESNRMTLKFVKP